MMWTPRWWEWFGKVEHQWGKQSGNQSPNWCCLQKHFTPGRKVAWVKKIPGGCDWYCALFGCKSNRIYVKSELLRIVANLVVSSLKTLWIEFKIRVTNQEFWNLFDGVILNIFHIVQVEFRFIFYEEKSKTAKISLISTFWLFFFIKQEAMIEI